MGSSSAKAPEPSQAEEALMKEQVDLLRQQRDALSEQLRQQNLLAPILYKSAGIKPIMDKDGKIIGFEEVADPTKTLRDEINMSLLKRQSDALKGNLPVDPALERELGEQEQVLRESLRKQLGPGYETGTAGGGRLADFTKRSTELRDAARRGDLTLAEQLQLAREGGNEQLLQNFINQASGINQRGVGNTMALGQAAAGFSNPLSTMFNNRQLQYQGRALSAQLRQQNTNAWIGFAGDLVGAAAMGAAASTAKVKKDIKPLDKDEYRKALKKVRDMPITRWRYLWESDDREPHVGPILEMSPQEIKHDENHLSLLDFIGLTTAAVKGLDREVRTLRQAMAKA